MIRVKNILDFLNQIAPLMLQEEWDNSGLLIGNEDMPVKKVMLALDVTSAVIDDAITNDCNLIITHHPAIFKPLKKIRSSNVEEHLIYRLIRNDISVISMHTNMDKAVLNTLLLQKLGIVKVDEEFEYLHVGYLSEPVSVENYKEFIKKSLNIDGVRYYDANRLCRKIGCCSGSGSSEIFQAINCGCDTYVTADIKHNFWLIAKEAGINLIDAEHFNTENILIPFLSFELQDQFPEIEFMAAESNLPVIRHG